MADSELTITAFDGLPEVRPGDDLCALLIAALEAKLSPPPAGGAAS